jgi:hypothetical protein
MMDAKNIDIDMVRAFIVHFFEPEKASKLLDFLEQDLFESQEDSEIHAIMTCAAVIAGLMPNRDLAVKIVDCVYDISEQTRQYHEDKAHATKH